MYGAALLFTPSGYFFHCCHTYVVRAPTARKRDLKKTTLSIIFDGPCGFYFYQTRPPPSQGKKTYVKNFLCQYYYLRPIFHDISSSYSLNLNCLSSFALSFSIETRQDLIYKHSFQAWKLEVSVSFSIFQKMRLLWKSIVGAIHFGGSSLVCCGSNHFSSVLHVMSSWVNPSLTLKQCCLLRYWWVFSTNNRYTSSCTELFTSNGSLNI